VCAYKLIFVDCFHGVEAETERRRAKIEAEKVAEVSYIKYVLMLFMYLDVNA
jgi:hypothetical protein